MPQVSSCIYGKSLRKLQYVISTSIVSCYLKMHQVNQLELFSAGSLKVPAVTNINVKSQRFAIYELSIQTDMKNKTKRHLKKGGCSIHMC